MSHPHLSDTTAPRQGNTRNVKFILQHRQQAEERRMPVPNPPIHKAPQPTKILFDPFNSSSTGHQRAENRLSGSTSWRDSRTYKLTSQLKDPSGRGGALHLSDLVGAGSVDFGKDGRKANGGWEKDSTHLREDRCQDIRGMMTSRKRRASDQSPTNVLKKAKSDPTPLMSSLEREHISIGVRDLPNEKQKTPIEGGPDDVAIERTTSLSVTPIEPKPRQIFTNLTIYVNGSTAPLVSDHRLKNLFVSHGGNICLGLARRSVTHVILGETGLAAGKIQKEIRKVRGKGVKFVTAAWVVDSVKAGKRKDEAEYVPRDLGIGGTRQRSVREMLGKTK